MEWTSSCAAESALRWWVSPVAAVHDPLSIMRLLPEAARIADGRVLLEGADLLALS